MKKLIFGLALFISGFFASIALSIAYFVVLEVTKSGDVHILLVNYLKTGHFIPLLISISSVISFIGLIICIFECYKKK